jgi:hypothetical protein
MVKIRLKKDVARRLGCYLESPVAATRTDHWRRFGKLNAVRIDGSHAVVSAGAGFDSEYEFNFRAPTLRERAARLVRALTGRSDLERYRSAYAEVLSESCGPVHSPQQIAALYYMHLIAHYPARVYLEIGPGSAYLAGLVHQKYSSRLILVDLPEILPLGFLYLHTRFPDATFSLPNEPGSAQFTFLTSGETIARDSVDLAVNTASFGEMNLESIARYFQLLRRVLTPGGLFFTVNREEKIMDGVPIRFNDYPWQANDKDLVRGVSALHELTQPQNRTLMRLCRLAKS